MRGITKMMRRLIISVNAGSSSVKLSLVDTSKNQIIWQETFNYKRPEQVASQFKTDVVSKIHNLPVTEINAVAHRVVDGGTVEVQEIDDAWMLWANSQQIHAPLHLPIQLEIIAIMRQLLPATKHIAVSDNAQFAQLPLSKRVYAIPMQLTEKYQLYKRGAHGLSVESVRRHLREHNQPYDRVVIMHLGSGSSVTALQDNQITNTSMGLTPTTGVVMGTRSGDVDFMLVQALMVQAGLSLDEVIHLLNEQSGLLGLSDGLSSDQRLLLADESINKYAHLAIEVLVDSIVGYAAKFIAELGGVDAIIFTGGMGENSVEMRRRVLEGLSVFGVFVDDKKNERNAQKIQNEDSKADVLVLPTNEACEMVRKVMQVL
ncbi:hypothetical protein EFL50_10690 [Weissella cibaria]|nr:hypothetical protein [Weissella cibaria]